MHARLSLSLFAAVLGAALAGSAQRARADDHRFDPRAERRDEHREGRHDDHRDAVRSERRDVRAVDVRDHRRPYEAPPAVRYERHANRPGYVWVNGGWDWRDGRYVWAPGHHERERRGYRWREPRWEQRDGAYIRVDGGWMTAGPVAAPPVLREERWAPRPGFVWVRGYWDWRGDQWAWMPGHYERERVGYIWRDPRWEPRDGVYVRVEGTWVNR